MNNPYESINKNGGIYSLLLLLALVFWIAVSWFFPTTLFWSVLYFVVVIPISILLSFIISHQLLVIQANGWKIGSITHILLGFAAPLVVTWIVVLTLVFMPVPLLWQLTKQCRIALAPDSTIRSLPSMVKPLFQTESSLLFHL